MTNTKQSKEAKQPRTPRRDRIGYGYVCCPVCGSNVIVENRKITIHSRGNNILCTGTGQEVTNQ